MLGKTTSATGVGVVARGSGTSGTALEIADGAIKVFGAGLNSSTPVFIHQATEANTGINGTTIDHPHTNGSPNAILIVTHNRSPGGVAGANYLSEISVRYVGTQWTIYDGSFFGIPVGTAFNVLVIKP